MCAGHPVPQRASTWTYPDGGVDKGTCTVVVVMVVFRDDLRVHKHAAFTHAIKEAAIVRRCFCSTRGSSGSRRLSSSAQASTAPSFLWKACVRAYAAHSAGGGGMLFRVGVAEKMVANVSRQMGTKRVSAHKEINGDELAVEQKLQVQLFCLATRRAPAKGMTRRAPAVA